jgi:translation initiation factor 1
MRCGASSVLTFKFQLKKMSKKKHSANGIIYSTDPSFNQVNEEAEHEATLPPSAQPLKIRLDTKHRSGKAVTLIENFTGTEDDLEKLGKQLKTFCGTGGSVKDRQIIIQGDQREKVFQWLKKNGYNKASKK